MIARPDTRREAIAALERRKGHVEQQGVESHGYRKVGILAQREIDYTQGLIEVIRGLG